MLSVGHSSRSFIVIYVGLFVCVPCSCDLNVIVLVHMLLAVCMLSTKERRGFVVWELCSVVSSHHHEAVFSGVLSKFSADSAQYFSCILCLAILLFLDLHVQVREF